VRLSAAERELLHSLPDQLRSLLLETGDVDDPALRRLFPPVSRDDDELNVEFERLVRDDLLGERLETLDTLSARRTRVLTEDGSSPGSPR
jgi:hypothetical protein